MPPAQALIFDMDGLLLDTERLYVMATQAVIAPWGHVVTPEVYGDWIGRDVSADEFAATYPTDLSADEFVEQMRAHFHRLCETDLSLMPGALEFLDGAAAGYPKAVASSTKRETIDKHLQQLGLIDRFPVRVSGRDVPRGKPAPDVFLVAAAGLGVEPAACVVFEDSMHGCIGARAAGMRVVAVPSIYTAHLDFSAADRVVTRLDEVGTGWLTSG
ncbi:MAG: HAD family phosphatase [Armatimonadetes bacterium]|nr:HAD family phosphatase [Armatimonadota bacterium]